MIDFELWVECSNVEEAERQAQHFTGLGFTLLSGLAVTWQLEINPRHLEYVKAFGVTLRSPQLSRYGVRTVQDAVDMSESGVRLYHHLLTAPEFLFARAALELTLIPSAELDDFFELQAGGFHTCGFSCVLSQQLAQRFEPLRFFNEFRPGYVWNGYHGEEYRPLGSSDNPRLLILRQELLPSPPWAAAANGGVRLPQMNGVET